MFFHDIHECQDFILCACFPQFFMWKTLCVDDFEILSHPAPPLITPSHKKACSQPTIYTCHCMDDDDDNDDDDGEW